MRTITVVGLVATIAMTAAACGGPSSSPGTPTPTTPASAPAGQLTPGANPTLSGPPTDDPFSGDPSANQASGSPNAPSPADPGQPAAPDRLGQPFATRTSATRGFKVRLELYPVLRDGATSHVNVTLSSTATENDLVGASLLGNGRIKAHDSGAADGIELVDGKHAQLYLVATDGHGHCLCSDGLDSVFLSKNPVLLSATFAAPPADVTAVDVRIPNFGTVKDVPVQ